jgi:D-alanyl-D-alanine dipeptidase
MWPLLAVLLLSPSELVDVATVIPDIALDIRYATADNFTKQVVYPEARCVLRRSVAERLKQVEADLRARKLRLKIFDCYRPLSVQRRFWELVPDERYVADPKKGSRHNRGAALDLTLTDEEGRPLEMPSAYDDFTRRAHRDFADAPKAALEHRRILEEAMVKRGFLPMPTEWWHFDAPDWKRYPIDDVPFGKIRR